MVSIFSILPQTLYFTEAWFNSVGHRVFDVVMEGVVVLNDYDIVAASGGKLVAVTETIIADVLDGQLNIDFVSVTGVGAVSAISVVGSSP